MYKVGNTEFETFDEVVKWVWNTHKIDANFIDHLSMHEDLMQQACEQLTTMIEEDDYEAEQCWKDIVSARDEALESL